MLLVLASVALIATGAVDLDWQLVSYRYSEWHRNNMNWEYNPFLKINWYLAYILNLARIVAGCLVLGFSVNEIRHQVKK